MDNIFGKFFNGKTINTNELQLGIDKMDPEALRVIQNLQKSPKYKNKITTTQISKGASEDDKKRVREGEMLNEGMFCCWLVGGCCSSTIGLSSDDSGATHEHDGGGGIDWSHCCKGGAPKNCCGGVHSMWKVGPDGGEEEIQAVNEELKEEIKRIRELLK